MIIGYSRVSRTTQNLDRQIDRLEQYGCDKILSEKMTGTTKERPELNKLKDIVRSGDTVVVESFSRLGRSLKDLLELIEFFKNNNVNIVSLNENFDATSPQGKLMMQLFQVFAEFERDLIVQRTKDGIKAARARGRLGGRPSTNQKKVDTALALYDSQKYSVTEVTRMTGVSRATLYKYIHLRDRTQ